MVFQQWSRNCADCLLVSRRTRVLTLTDKAPWKSHTYCHGTRAVGGRGNLKLTPNPYRREGLFSEREVLYFSLAFGLVGKSSAFTGEKMQYYTGVATANDRNVQNNWDSGLNFPMTFCYSFPSWAQISRFLLVYMSLKIWKARTSRKLAEL